MCAWRRRDEGDSSAASLSCPSPSGTIAGIPDSRFNAKPGYGLEPPSTVRCAVDTDGRRALAIASGYGVLAMSGISAAPPIVPTFKPALASMVARPLGSDPVDTIGSARLRLTACDGDGAYGFSTNPQLLNRWLTAHGGLHRERPAALAASGGRTQGSCAGMDARARIASQLRRMTDTRISRHSPGETQLDAGGWWCRGAAHGNMHLSHHRHSGSILYINDPCMRRTLSGTLRQLSQRHSGSYSE